MNLLNLYKPRQIFVHVDKQKLYITELSYNDVNEDITLIENIYKKMNLGNVRYRSLSEIIRIRKFHTNTLRQNSYTLSKIEYQNIFIMN